MKTLKSIEITAMKTSAATTRQQWKITGGLIYLGALFLVVFYFDPWFDATLYRHIAGQFPLLLLLGFLAGSIGLSRQWGSRDMRIHFSILLFFLCSLSFWMLPVSIDAAALSNRTDLLMAAHLWFAGLLVGSQFRYILPEIKCAFLFMVSMMVFASGTLLKHIDMLLCGAYTLQQQKILASYLIFGGIAILLLSFFFLALSLRKRPA